MTRKFLFCFPLRVGNIVFGYILIAISIAVVAFHLYELLLNIVADDDADQARFRSWSNFGKIFGTDTSSEAIVSAVIMSYYLSYIVIGLLLFFFTVMFIIGAHKANYCLVTTFFSYSFIHLFLSLGLVIWEATSNGWIQLGLILASDLLLIICLFSVRYLMEAIRTGNIYTRPGEEYYKY